jgi:hypothetical protein
LRTGAASRERSCVLKVGQGKQVRFAEVIQRAGRPELVTLWVDPAKDRDFQKAIREDRVMTIDQPTVGSRKDFGVVGFHPGKGVAYLRFPKSLSAFKDRRIIGIKYDLLNNAPPAGRRLKSLKAAAGRPFKPYIWTAPKSKSDNQKFRVTLRFTANEEVTEVVMADSRKAASEMAKRQAKLPQFSKDKITTKVVKVSKAE